MPPIHPRLLRARLCHTLLFVLAAGLGSSAQAAGSAEKGLMRLEPKTRMMQVCDIRMARDMRGNRDYPGVDRVMVDAVTRPAIADDSVSGDGGAFRSKGRWFRFSFACELAPDHLKALALTFEIGDEIPEEEWERFGLWR
ncbi:DUF930 domain-containing protein [Microvirga sp. BT291]|nr:DUF930 domain-containing protein [Microvirga pudoricolor]